MTKATTSTTTKSAGDPSQPSRSSNPRPTQHSREESGLVDPTKQTPGPTGDAIAPTLTRAIRNVVCQPPNTHPQQTPDSHTSGQANASASRSGQIEGSQQGGPTGSRNGDRASIARPPPFRADRHRPTTPKTMLSPYVTVRTFATDQARNAVLSRATRVPHGPDDRSCSRPLCPRRRPAQSTQPPWFTRFASRESCLGRVDRDSLHSVAA